MFHYVPILWPCKGDDISEYLATLGSDHMGDLLKSNQLITDDPVHPSLYGIVQINPIQTYCKYTRASEIENNASFIAYGYAKDESDKLQPIFIGAETLIDVFDVMKNHIGKPMKIVGVWYHGYGCSSPEITEWISACCNVINSCNKDVSIPDFPKNVTYAGIKPLKLSQVITCPDSNHKCHFSSNWFDFVTRVCNVQSVPELISVVTNPTKDIDISIRLYESDYLGTSTSDIEWLLTGTYRAILLTSEMPIPLKEEDSPKLVLHIAPSYMGMIALNDLCEEHKLVQWSKMWLLTTSYVCLCPDLPDITFAGRW